MLLHASEESETRTLTIIGAAVMLCIVAVAGQFLLFNPLGGRPKDAISVTIDAPYVGQGVAVGTAVVMHGVKVGQVRAISSLPMGGVRLDTYLQAQPTAGLTDTMGIDFRPTNHFGVTGISLSPGSGGQPLRDGSQINTVPHGNFSLQALLTRLGQITTGVVTPQLIQVIDKATRYIDALDPLVETTLIAANAVAQAQTVPTARLLANATALSVPYPAFVNSLVDAGDGFTHSNTNFTHIGIEDLDDDIYVKRVIPTYDEAVKGLFTALGKLESSHVGDLLSVTDIVKALFDVVPPLIRPEAIGQMLVELRSRFEKMYGGTPEQRALRVRIVLDSLPGVAAPIGAIGGP